MRDFMLILHFVSLAMGLGVGFSFMVLGMVRSKMAAEEQLDLQIKCLPIAKVGKLGMVLLILSGGYLLTPYLESFGSMPWLHVKFTLVLVMLVLIVLNTIKAKKLKKEPSVQNSKTVDRLGILTQLTAILTVVSAVLVFH